MMTFNRYKKELYREYRAEVQAGRAANTSFGWEQFLMKKLYEFAHNPALPAELPGANEEE